MRATVVIGLVLAAILVATMRPDVTVSIAVGQTHYRPGAGVDVRLHNRSEKPVAYNACSWTLERRGDIGWQPVRRPDERRCTTNLRTLPPRQAARAEYALAEDLPAGRYRLRIALRRGEAGQQVLRRTASFLVEP